MEEEWISERSRERNEEVKKEGTDGERMEKSGEQEGKLC